VLNYMRTNIVNLWYIAVNNFNVFLICSFVVVCLAILFIKHKMVFGTKLKLVDLKLN